VILSKGSRIAQYEIIESIGAGGMGEVYRARDSRLAREVAIKVMAPHVAADPEMRRRFETEARAIAALSHASIVAIHELAVVDDVPVAVMELLEGQTLRQRVKTGAFGWQEAVRIGAEIADGLAAAHLRGIVHRDLKPENIFLTTAGAVKILDFGLALHRHALPNLGPDGPTVARTAANVVLGTFGYMSPEQVTGDRVDARTDIFALGCVLYEMVAGRPRFEGATPQEVIARLLHESGQDLSTFDLLGSRELSAGGGEQGGVARSRPCRSLWNACARKPLLRLELGGRRTLVPEIDRAEPGSRQCARVLRADVIDGGAARRGAGGG
jgi:serine/threonine protein kinase